MSTAIASPFRIAANNKEGGDYERPPSGTHPAILIALVDLGTHTDSFQGESKDSHKLLLAWELTGECDSKGQTFVIGQEYTWSLGKKANLRGLIESWRGKALADGEEIDLGEYLGRPCQISLKDEVSKNGSSFSKIASVSAPMKGLTIPPATRTIFGYALADQKDDKPPAFPAWLPFVFGVNPVEKLQKCHEWAKLPDTIPF